MSDAGGGWAWSGEGGLSAVPLLGGGEVWWVFWMVNCRGLVVGRLGRFFGCIFFPSVNERGAKPPGSRQHHALPANRTAFLPNRLLQRNMADPEREGATGRRRVGPNDV